MSIPSNWFEQIINTKMQMIVEQAFWRGEILAHCKTEEEKNKYLDRWAIEDAAERIAEAIENQNFRQEPRKLFGIF